MTQWSHHLQAELQRRKEANPLYGLRAFARQLKVSPAQLSQMISGKRPVGKRMAQRLAIVLQLTPGEKNFLETEVTPETKRSLDEEHFAVIAHWIHFAILSLAETKNNRSDVRWVARRLGVKVEEAREAIERLTRLGLLEIRDQQLVATTRPLQTSNDVASASIRRSHRHHLELAARKLDEVPVEWREFTTLTMAINTQKMKQAKQLVKKFKHDMEELLESGKTSEVYTLAVQLYPLTSLPENPA